MPRLAPALVLVACLMLAGCSSPATGSGGADDPSPAPVSSESPATTEVAAAGRGTITFSGATSGTMSLSICHGDLAQLTVEFDDGSPSTNGLISADEFTFVGPDSNGFTLMDGEKPTVSGKTYTVEDTQLVGIMSEETVKATGSVTCP